MEKKKKNSEGSLTLKYVGMKKTANGSLKLKKGRETLA